MTYTDADTSFHALPADIRARVEARIGKPPRPMSTMEIMAAIGQEIVAERERCAAQAHLIKHLAENTTERNWADKRLYIMQAADRIVPPAGDETE